VVAPDGLSTTTYSYQGNTVTVTDPKGIWKKFTTDALGNLVTGVEPRPGGGADYATSYTYNFRNQLTDVSMPRDGYTQTRTFVYNNGGQLTSATNPGNGTVTYSYAGARLDYKRDAKNQKTQYRYDSGGRVTAVEWWSPTNTLVGTRTFEYDSSFFGQAVQGRLARVSWGGMSYSYSYHPAGAVTAKRVIAFPWMSSRISYAMSYAIEASREHFMQNLWALVSLGRKFKKSSQNYAVNLCLEPRTSSQRAGFFLASYTWGLSSKSRPTSSALSAHGGLNERAGW
jgi:hypothetical protein